MDKVVSNNLGCDWKFYKDFLAERNTLVHNVYVCDDCGCWFYEDEMKAFGLGPCPKKLKEKQERKSVMARRRTARSKVEYEDDDRPEKRDGDEDTSRTPDYRLKIYDHATGNRTIAGSAWNKADGSIAIKLNPCVVLQNHGERVVFNLFPVD